MARIPYWEFLVDSNGQPLRYIDVRVYLAGTLTEADIYMHANFGAMTTSSVGNLKTDKDGFFQFFIGDRYEVNGGYNEFHQFKVRWYNDTDSRYEEIDNIYLHTPVTPVSTSDSVKGQASNRDKNKVISNTQGFNWNRHKDIDVLDEAVHNINPAVLFNTNTSYNRVISNKLGYQMYELATSAGSPAISGSIAVSAAMYHTETILPGGWSPSAIPSAGAVYCIDVNHNFNNYYPLVNLINISNNGRNNFQITPIIVKSISPSATRIWVDDNLKTKVVIIG